MRSILIVDDEFGLADTIGEVLAQLGWAVTTAINGRLGLAAIEQAEPNVILLDLMMPVMTGTEMLRALQADEVHRDLPVILMSAIERESIPRDVAPRIAGFLQKPFTLDELLELLDRCLPM